MSIRLYGFWRSMATYRVRVALKLKRLAFEEMPVDLFKGEQYAAAYDALNAAHALPTLVDGDFRLNQSLAILEYLDERYPAIALLPHGAGDLAERARIRALALDTVADAHPLTVPRIRNYIASTYGADPSAIEAWAQHWLGLGLQTYERALAARPPAPFVGGTAPGLADICIASHAVAARMFHLGLEGAPRVAALHDACAALDAFATSHPLRQPGAPASI